MRPHRRRSFPVRTLEGGLLFKFVPGAFISEIIHLPSSRRTLCGNDAHLFSCEPG